MASIVGELASDLFRRRYESLNKKWEELPPKKREEIEKWIVRKLKKRIREEHDKYKKRQRAQKRGKRKKK